MNEHLEHTFKRYGATLFWIIIAIIGYNFLPYYHNFLNNKTKITLLILASLYAILAFPIIYYTTKNKPPEPNKSILALQLLKNIPRNIHEQEQIPAEQKNAILFTLVKFFFTPLMINFLFSNFNILNSTPKTNYYAFILIALFTIDTLIFTVGYLIEHPKLKNTLRSVEPTLFGWVVALICYPPFNQIVGAYIPWGANDMATYSTETITLIARITIIALLLIYVSASRALGFKASNLTNRGIVTQFPYSIVRHPAYISKVSLWWITLLPVINISFALGMVFWTIIYLCRALTEERHLMHDPEYQEYCKKVKYKFIPKII